MKSKEYVQMPWAKNGHSLCMEWKKKVHVVGALPIKGTVVGYEAARSCKITCLLS